ncbi:hypothetical protein SGFS_007100 [Streptomyces graminofaciens]|uniref:Uncharacterized protein n=1 Tax=Streptomyces graminofaciens TaxID=68212 RepID=A0ABM7F1J0_9ACTN|nr:hypothetical protein [Streptomyces graminofaciens]BBC29416.1 hypothetical protein SGFS_007100 [Streptomyces graminofaciens]
MEWLDGLGDSAVWMDGVAARKITEALIGSYRTVLKDIDADGPAQLRKLLWAACWSAKGRSSGSASAQMKW